MGVTFWVMANGMVDMRGGCSGFEKCDIALWDVRY
jgi:hypothetical protein